MEKSETKFCPAMWLSGFFGLGAVAHLIRMLTGFSLAVAGHEIPLIMSGVIAIVFGALSAGLLWLSLKRPCGSSEKCCK